MFTFLVGLWKEKHEEKKQFAFKSDVHSSVTISRVTSGAEESTKWKKSSHEGSHVNA